MKRVSINWVYPFWGSRIIFFLFIVVVLFIDLYFLPLIALKLSINQILLICSIEILLSSLFVFGQFNRSKYLKQKKLFKFIKLNQLYITQITETKEKNILKLWKWNGLKIKKIRVHLQLEYTI